MSDSAPEQRPAGGVKWHLGVSPEVLTEYAGTTLRAYYNDAATMLYTQRQANRRFHELYGVEVTAPHVATPAYIGAAALGADVVFPERDAPMVANQGRVLRRPEQVLALAPAGPAACEMMQRFLAMLPYFERETGGRVPVGAGQEGPVTTAALLRGERFLEDLHQAPHLAHRLLEVVTETEIAFCRYVGRINGTKPGSPVGIADDFAGLIRPEMWPEFVMPYWRRVFEELGPGPRHVHSELLRLGHLPFLEELGVDHFDPGVDQYLTAQEVAAAIDIPFTEYIWPVRDLLLGTPESIRRQFEADAGAGASVIVADVSSPDIPSDNIRAFIAVARQYER